MDNNHYNIGVGIGGKDNWTHHASLISKKEDDLWMKKRMRRKNNWTHHAWTHCLHTLRSTNAVRHFYLLVCKGCELTCVAYFLLLVLHAWVLFFPLWSPGVSKHSVQELHPSYGRIPLLWGDSSSLPAFISGNLVGMTYELYCMNNLWRLIWLVKPNKIGKIWKH